MSRKREKLITSISTQGPKLPKNALSRISFGDSFAEYDALLHKNDVFVTTNAYEAARDPLRNKCFFIGRRGTGKTAITIQLQKNGGQIIQIFPEVFGPINSEIDLQGFADSHQKAFKSVTTAFELALQFELIYYLLERGNLSEKKLPDFVQRELKFEDNKDFDLRTVRFVQRILEHLSSQQDTQWLKDIKRPKVVAQAINANCDTQEGVYSIVIDRIDESWEGSDSNVRFLAALMHACGEMTTRVLSARALLFLRENVFERVRQTDSEFARIETRAVGLDWTEEKLVEFVERRLNEPFNSKWQLGGPSWNVFFEVPDKARRLVFDFCQNRPRDVLTYVKFAIENGAARNHDRILIEDLLSARKRFSDSRLKDLGDEYDENYPRIQVVLEKFYGLGWRFTRQGMESLIQKLLVDEEIRAHCAAWFYANASPPQTFVNLLFQIGFLGIVDARGDVCFRSVGPQTTSTPAITAANDFVVHPMYRDALDLQDIVVNTGVHKLQLGTVGLIEELPDGVDLSTYAETLTALESELASIHPGLSNAARFEKVVGEVIRLCFFRSLGNIEPKCRTYDGHIIRDWIASNRGSNGFWEMVRIKWGATQVVWECKNYDELKSDDFQQIAYYMNDEIGRFGIVVFRGDTLAPSYWPHLQRILRDKKGLILLMNDKDLKVFIRQARAGKVKEAHIQDRYDYTLRKIS